MTVGGTTFRSADSSTGRLLASLPGPSTSQEASRPSGRDQTHHADHGEPPTSRIDVEQTRHRVGARQRRVGEPAKGSIRPRNQRDRDTDHEEHDPGDEQETCATLWRHGVSVASLPGPWWVSAGSPRGCHQPTGPDPPACETSRRPAMSAAARRASSPKAATGPSAPVWVIAPRLASTDAHARMRAVKS